MGSGMSSFDDKDLAEIVADPRGFGGQAYLDAKKEIRIRCESPVPVFLGSEYPGNFPPSRAAVLARLREFVAKLD